ncbi:PREDICTED: membrane-anchored lipid-binding protein LAM4-like isoform X1 [Trachymyrmex septentrionalis]|uniref:membrane-anchored lipid-binding protein LAM4-like isoform X1 n=1 Tax=Trachymyrmex septentrionalis TaxID=34720 RepID=UPI00084F1371|nr:PREDICTED: membrane-anchored lipid-binding protein LAM4-like isoform X1 [Trachymyrmex septentrionalis]
MLDPEVEAVVVNLRRGSSCRIPSTSSVEESELGLRRGGSLKISRTSDDHHAAQERLTSTRSSPSSTLSTSSSTVLTDRCAGGGGNNRTFRSARRYVPEAASDAPAPEYLARSLLQLGCPAVSMPTPRGGVGSEQPPSSDSDDYTAHHEQGAGYGQNLDSYTLPKVKVSGPSNADESASIINGSAGSIGARSAPSTPLQAAPEAGGQQSISGSQLTVAGASYPQPPRSPSHAALKCNDSHLSKPLSRSTPSMAAGGVQTPAKVSRTSSRSSPTTSSARQKKFHRHFSQSSKFRYQVADDERVLNYYSCALVGDILLQGHLYITPNYFAFYSNVFGYVTKLLIPTVSVLKISKEKTAKIIPNAVAVATEEERHVFCSLLSRDSTYKLMKQVWDAAMEPQTTVDALPEIDTDTKRLAPDDVDDDSSVSESGTDITQPNVCTTDPDGAPEILNKPNLAPPRLETAVLTKTLTPSKSDRLRSLFTNGLKPGMVITILVALLAVLYVSAALMMMRIDRLHTAYLNHPLVSPERFTQDRLLHYLNTNLDQIVKVRQSLQTLSQQFVTMSRGGSQTGSAGGVVEPEDAPS